MQELLFVAVASAADDDDVVMMMTMTMSLMTIINLIIAVADKFSNLLINRLKTFLPRSNKVHVSLTPNFSRPPINSRVQCISPSNTYSISEFRISALLRAVIICPGDRKTTLCNRRAIVPISPGVTEDPV